MLARSIELDCNNCVLKMRHNHDESQKPPRPESFSSNSNWENLIVKIYAKVERSVCKGTSKSNKIAGQPISMPLIKGDRSDQPHAKARGSERRWGILRAFLIVIIL